MADAEVVLLTFDGSMFGLRVRVALNEKGIEYENKEENIISKSPLLLQMNPIHKKVSVLIHNGKPVCESLIILEYLEEVWKDRALLLPSDPYLKSQARFWAEYIDKKVYPASRGIWREKGVEQEIAKKEFVEIMKQLEDTLGDKPYFGGDTFGFVDVALIGFYSWFYTYEKFGNLKFEQCCPKIIQWGERCMQRESVSKSLPDQIKVYESVCIFKKINGLN